jgi:hypothetical protein
LKWRLTLCRAKVEEFQISEVKYESLCDESITTIKKREKQLIDGITKHSLKLQNEHLASAPLSSFNFSGRIFSIGSKLCLLCLYETQSAHIGSVLSVISSSATDVRTFT